MEAVTITDEIICQSLWKKFNLKELSLGITGSFEFRKFYSSLFGAHPYFACDNVENPTYILPLCYGKNGLDWFGTKELEDPPFYCQPDACDQFLLCLKKNHIQFDAYRFNERQLHKIKELLPIQSLETAGTKVVVGCDTHLSGNSHWSKRNLHRAEKEFASLSPQWSFNENPKRSQVSRIFEESIEMFSFRNRISKFEDDNRKKKYANIFTSRIPGIKTVVAICEIDNLPAIEILILLCDDIATVPTVVINVRHPKNKIILQHGFRYAIMSLPPKLRQSYGCTLTDYQGGCHSWKKEVSPMFQISQYHITLDYGRL